MDPVVQSRPEISPVSSETWNQSNSCEHGDGAETSKLRAQVDRLQQREAQMMALIGCRNPDKLVHDLRNVLNELQLLRMLAETDKG